jgi:hypothetical protein
MYFIEFYVLFTLCIGIQFVTIVLTYLHSKKANPNSNTRILIGVFCFGAGLWNELQNIPEAKLELL